MVTYQWKPFTLLVSAEEVKGNEMKIEAGKYYKTCDGRKVGPVEVSEYNRWYPEAKFRVPGYGLIQENGRFGHNEDPSRLDLISEWQDDAPPPIRTVTRREVVSGEYGCVDVDVYSGGMSVVVDFSTVRHGAEELREAAHLLNQIAEVLEGNGESSI